MKVKVSTHDMGKSHIFLGALLRPTLQPKEELVAQQLPDVRVDEDAQERPVVVRHRAADDAGIIGASHHKLETVDLERAVHVHHLPELLQRQRVRRC